MGSRHIRQMADEPVNLMSMHMARCKRICSAILKDQDVSELSINWRPFKDL
ncbi:hypothetical protein IF2G_04530 [Cordyceps javanica]|nr:hypothetical protein IF2G_04530 [Cordyceps javanica]